MKEKIIITLKLFFLILFILFYAPLVLLTVEEKLTGALEVIGVILYGVTLIIGMVATIILVSKQLDMKD